MKRLKGSVKKSAALAFERKGLDIISAISHPRDITRGIPAISSVSLDHTVLYKSQEKATLRRIKSDSDGGGVAGAEVKVESGRAWRVPSPPTTSASTPNGVPWEPF